MASTRSLTVAVMALLFVLLCLAPVRAEAGGSSQRGDTTDRSASDASDLKRLAEQQRTNTVAAKSLDVYQRQLTDLSKQLSSISKQVQADEAQVNKLDQSVRALLADAKCSNADRQSLQRISKQIASELKLIASTERDIKQTQAKIRSLGQLIDQAEYAKSISALESQIERSMQAVQSAVASAEQEEREIDDGLRDICAAYARVNDKRRP